MPWARPITRRGRGQPSKPRRTIAVSGSGAVGWILTWLLALALLAALAALLEYAAMRALPRPYRDVSCDQASAVLLGYAYSESAKLGGPGNTARDRRRRSR